MLRLFLACALLAGVPVTRPGVPGGPETHALWRASGPACADVAGEARAGARLGARSERGEPRTSGPGDGARPGVAPRPRKGRLADAAGRADARPAPAALERGELPDAQAFLRVNGSANAHGARA
jgi:hypothetical protein